MIGLVHSYLPYMILTCYISLQAIDDSADRGGAQPRRHALAGLFRRVILPLSLPGVLAGVGPDLRAGDRLVHGAAHPGRQEGVMLGMIIEDQFTVDRQLAARRGPVLHDAGDRAADLPRRSIRSARKRMEGLMKLGSALLTVHLWLVLVFLYLPIVVMVAMAFNRSPLYELPFTFDLVWFKALAGNDQAARTPAGTASGSPS